MRTTTLCSSLLAASALILGALPAAADSRDIDSLGVPFRQCIASVPDIALPAQPGSSVNDGAFPHICGVNMPQQGPLQATTGEWIMFRVGDQESTLADCLVFEANVTVSFALDGKPVDVNHLPCQLLPDGTAWRTDYRFLSHPLSPGVYVVTATFTSSGGSFTFTRTITVIPQG
jgi:hypothetical protein